MAETTMRNHMKERFGKVNNFCEIPPLPKKLNIELNNTCNHKCQFCGFHGQYSQTKLKPAVMPLETAKRVLDEAHRLGMGKYELGVYMAGEAFLHPDLAEFIAYAKGLGYPYIFITSNGALATPEKMRAVLDAGLDSIRFSVNAADRGTYKEIHGKDDFEAVCENIRYMRRYINERSLKVATSISFVVTKKTENMQEQMKAMLGEYVDDIYFIPVYLDGLNCDDEYRRETQVIDDSDATINNDYVCPVPFDTMYIKANLQVVPCCYAYNDELYDLKENLDLQAAWNCDRYRKYRDIFIKHASDEDTGCWNCMLRMKGIERIGL